MGLPMPTDVLIMDSILYDLLEQMSDKPMAFDLETTSLDPRIGEIRSIAVANDAGNVAIDYRALSSTDQSIFMDWLLKQELIAHNMVFDGLWLYQKTGIMPKIKGCTLIIYKLLAAEGEPGQRYGLKTTDPEVGAMVEVLGWKESNEKELYDWLAEHNLKAGDMAQAPWDILGKYNGLDTIGTWQLYKAFQSITAQYEWNDYFWSYIHEEINTLTELVIEQNVKGLPVDIELLLGYDKELEGKIDRAKDKLFTHAQIKPYITKYQKLLVKKFKQPGKKKKTAKGKWDKNYGTYLNKLALLARSTDFNLNSPQQLQWLLYDCLEFECPIKTDTGSPTTGKDAYPYLGEIGQLLKRYRKQRDKRKFVKSLLEVERNGFLHPNLKISATVTGRCAGGQG